MAAKCAAIAITVKTNRVFGVINLPISNPEPTIFPAREPSESKGKKIPPGNPDAKARTNKNNFIK